MSAASRRTSNLVICALQGAAAAPLTLSPGDCRVTRNGNQKSRSSCCNAPRCRLTELLGAHWPPPLHGNSTGVRVEASEILYPRKECSFVRQRLHPEQRTGEK